MKVLQKGCLFMRAVLKFIVERQDVISGFSLNMSLVSFGGAVLSGENREFGLLLFVGFGLWGFIISKGGKL
jgi:hypothetical protein